MVRQIVCLLLTCVEFDASHPMEPAAYHLCLDLHVTVTAARSNLPRLVPSTQFSAKVNRSRRDPANRGVSGNVPLQISPSHLVKETNFDAQKILLAHRQLFRGWRSNNGAAPPPSLL